MYEQIDKLLGPMKAAKMCKMLFEEVEMLVVGDQLAWDLFGYGEVNVDHFVRDLGLARGYQPDRSKHDRVNVCGRSG